MIYLVKYIIQKIMRKIKKCILCIVVLAMVMSINTSMVYAAGKSTTATAELVGRDIVVSGRVSGANQNNKVLLLVGSLEDVMYIKEMNTSSNGEFSFRFRLPFDTPAGIYPYSIGNNAGAPRYNGEIDFHYDTMDERKIVDADINIKLSGYVPRVTGVIRSIYGKNISVNVTDNNDNSVIYNNAITADSGICNLDFELPSILSYDAYKLSIVCTDDEEEMFSVGADIICQLYKVTVSAAIETSEDVRINATATSPNTDLINERGVFTNSWSKSITIPNIIPTAEFNVDLNVVETYLMKLGGDTGIVTGVSGEEVTVMAKGWDISTFIGRRFELTYDPTQVIPVSFFGMYPDDTVGTGRRGNVEIEKWEEGRIVFKIHNIDIPEGKTWTGVMNLFKFRFADGYTGDASLYIK